MSQGSPAIMTIGGYISGKAVTGFLEMLNEYSYAMQPPPKKGLKNIKNLRAYLKKGNGRLYLDDAETHDGTFGTLETFCIKNKIEFDRYTEADWQVAPERSAFRKGMVYPINIYTDVDGETLIPIEDVLAVMDNSEVSGVAMEKIVKKEYGYNLKKLPPIRFNKKKRK